MKDLHSQTYYELIEVDPNATQEEILKAFNRARATYGNNSPALYSLFNKEEAQELLKLIDEAYSTLSNQFKRKQYDRRNSEPQTEIVPSSSISPSATFSDDLAIPQGHDDFAIPQGHDSFSVGQSNNSGYESKGSALSNMGSTKFGKYQLDTNFEEQIKDFTDFPGPVLQKIRLYKNISLDQISDSTKISRTYLAAIERDDFKCLPAPVFVRGFIVQVAKILGLDSTKVASSFMKIMKENIPSSTNTTGA